MSKASPGGGILQTEFNAAGADPFLFQVTIEGLLMDQSRSRRSDTADRAQCCWNSFSPTHQVQDLVQERRELLSLRIVCLFGLATCLKVTAPIGRKCTEGLWVHACPQSCGRMEL